MLRLVALLASILVLPSPALAATPSAADIAKGRVALDRAVARYSKAAARLDAANRKTEEASADLDVLVARQDRAQARLNAQAASTYRLGRDPMLALVTGSTSFESLVSRWALLTRIHRQHAADLAELKAARASTMRSANDLMKLQQDAAAEKRALDKQVDRARADLSRNQAAYTEYRRRIAAQQAARARRAAAARAAARTAAAKSKSASTAAPSAPAAAASTGSAWKTGRASNYGPGSYGHRTANGTRIGPDSMIVAHKSLPFGTVVEFAYGSKHAVAVVADRGPYVPGRDWDLGPGVAHSLGLNGVYIVRYRIIGR